MHCLPRLLVPFAILPRKPFAVLGHCVDQQDDVLSVRGEEVVYPVRAQLKPHFPVWEDHPKKFPPSLSKTTQNFFVALDIEMMLAIPVGLYQTVPYSGMFPTLSTILTPLL